MLSVRTAEEETEQDGVLTLRPSSPEEFTFVVWSLSLGNQIETVYLLTPPKGTGTGKFHKCLVFFSRNNKKLLFIKVKNNNVL